MRLAAIASISTCTFQILSTLLSAHTSKQGRHIHFHASVDANNDIHLYPWKRHYMGLCLWCVSLLVGVQDKLEKFHVDFDET